MEKVESAADLEAAPGVKIAWNLKSKSNSWMGNVRDIQGNGEIDLIIAGEVEDALRVVRYAQDGQPVWVSEPINDGLGHELVR